MSVEEQSLKHDYDDKKKYATKLKESLKRVQCTLRYDKELDILDVSGGPQGALIISVPN